MLIRLSLTHHELKSHPSVHLWCAPFAGSSGMVDPLCSDWKPFLWKIFQIKTHITNYEERKATHQTFQPRLSLDPCCAPFAASSITVDNHPFNRITYWYSLSTYMYNFPALYQISFLESIFFIFCYTIE